MMPTNYNGKIIELKAHKQMFASLNIPTILSQEQRNAKIYAQILGVKI